MLYNMSFKQNELSCLNKIPGLQAVEVHYYICAILLPL
jgi:hypothetical protein